MQTSLLSSKTSMVNATKQSIVPLADTQDNNCLPLSASVASVSHTKYFKLPSDLQLLLPSNSYLIETLWGPTSK